MKTREPKAKRPAPLPRSGPSMRRLHFYVGLYFLVFIWLFSLSGLLLNHTWRSFSPNFQTASVERLFRVPEVTGDVAIARDLMGQLQLSGEIHQIERAPASDRFVLQVLRPDRLYRVRADLSSGRADVEERTTNLWGVMRGLHTFSGVSLTDPERVRDAVLTKVWSFSMDALAVGLVFLVLSGLYLWLPLKAKRRWGAVALGLGAACCSLFVFGLAAIF